MLNGTVIRVAADAQLGTASCLATIEAVRSDYLTALSYDGRICDVSRLPNSAGEYDVIAFAEI